MGNLERHVRVNTVLGVGVSNFFRVDSFKLEVFVVLKSIVLCRVTEVGRSMILGGVTELFSLSHRGGNLTAKVNVGEDSVVRYHVVSGSGLKIV